MSTTQINHNLIQINRLRFVNAFLVREEDGFTLVDTTVGGGADTFVEAARNAGGEIKRIALTHGHGDHVGSLDALKQKLGNTVQVLMPDLDARIHDGEKLPDGKKPPGSWPKITTKPDVRLTGGERIGSLEVVPTPGHTPGHVSFLDTRDRTVIVGDTLTSIGGLAVSNHFYWRFPLAAMATWDKGTDVESAKKIRTLEPALLVVGHGGPVRAPAAALDKAIARAGG
jgi:glyoxylase-like metal-dependent hydrolase (beta-lactamase superfamily II)